MISQKFRALIVDTNGEIKERFVQIVGETQSGRTMLLVQLQPNPDNIFFSACKDGFYKGHCPIRLRQDIATALAAATATSGSSLENRIVDFTTNERLERYRQHWEKHHTFENFEPGNLE